MTTDTDLAFTPAYRLRQMIADKQVSPVELTEMALARIDRLNNTLNAFLTVTADEAMEAARRSEQAVMRGESLGPLHGIPVSIKDLEGVKGVRNTNGSLVYKDAISDHDALTTERIRAAGAIIIGKTNTPEFGNSGTTENRLGDACRNPWDPTRTSGGSSGGAASSVAAGISPIAQGSDGGGSIRIPCGFCGIYGIKPTQGRVPRRAGGINTWHPINTSCVGPMTRSVRDAAVMLQILSGPAPDAEPGTIQTAPPDFESALGAGVAGLRIAWSADLGGAPVDPEVAAIAREAAGTFEGLRVPVVESDFKIDEHEAVFGTFISMFRIRAFSVNGHLLEKADLLTDYFRDNLEAGRLATARDYFDALSRLNRYRAYVEEFFTRYDLLLTPTLAVPAFPIDAQPEIIGGSAVPDRLWGYTPFTYPFNMAGNPAASVPCGFSADGLPVGLHIVGRRGDEESVLAASAAFEETRPWAEHRPRMASG